MPNLSPTMESGNLISWGKQVGDEVSPGDVLAAIETDKATIDFEMQEEGYIAKIMYPAGTKAIPLGDVMAILVENKEDIEAFKNYVPGAAASAPQAEVV
jgi:pyruvate dehydrogenase E2 component (dihydrolipoamide acetyltransferase)